MHVDIGYIIQIFALLGFAWAIFNYVVLKPQVEEREHLRSLIEEVRVTVKSLQDLVQKVNERLIIVERDTHSAHKRIDIIETSGCSSKHSTLRTGR